MTGIYWDPPEPYEEYQARYKEWWEIVFDGDVFATSDDIVQEIGPEYFFALDRGLQP